ncbi:hypothetical protein CGZ93_16330 [Enemella dayhoffiae]|uniref:DUF2510 domain-containing protein n=1 Tax=Enemella dayhoffiae TaxID=2016507 RepID=A0A255GQN6_9ACTN|nr:DUF2510 domain-containing protein [Enemella dayhoffiae]OYO18118.1 hypothetical protein CGZ93_16330 [Enemella dayhoffiae]
MQAPGWYPDPSGQPQSFRFWDGQWWTPVTTHDPRTPWPTPEELTRPGLQPLGADQSQQGPQTQPGQPAPGQPAPGTPGPGVPAPARSRTPLFIGLGAVLVLALVIAGALWFTRGGETTGPTSPPIAPPTSGPTSVGSSGPPTPTRLRCDNGNGNQTSQQAASYSSTGLRIDTPPSFTFRFDRNYWTWADDFAAWGRGPEGAGVVLAGIRAENGFSDPSRAGEQVLECMVASLSRQGGKTTSEGARTAPTTVDGMPAHRTTARLLSSEPKPLVVSITVIDSGQPGKLGQLIAFHPEGSPVQAEIEQAAASVRRG